MAVDTPPVEFKPLKVRPEGWRDAGATRTPTPFSAKYSYTRGQLDVELRGLRATAAFIQVEGPSNMVRTDGQLRADASPTHPGVILTIESPNLGTLVYETDEFRGWGDQKGWHANLRAIVLGLEALRRVERYGIAKRGQQYAGYRELTTGIALGPARMTIDQAQRLLDEEGGFKEAARRHHPDNGGDAAKFQRVTEAHEVLTKAGIEHS